MDWRGWRGGGAKGTGHPLATRASCLMRRRVDMEKGHERRGNPFTPSPGNVFSCVTRVAWRIFHPDRGRVITTAPGNSFWSKERILGARDARTSIMRRPRGQEGARKALGGHREGRALVYPPVMPWPFRDACLAWGIYHLRKRRSFTPPLY